MPEQYTIPGHITVIKVEPQMTPYPIYNIFVHGICIGHIATNSIQSMQYLWAGIEAVEQEARQSAGNLLEAAKNLQKALKDFQGA